jgi:hypothetical protein
MQGHAQSVRRIDSMRTLVTLWRDNAQRLAFIAAALAALLALGLTATLAPRALGFALADDALFVRLAQTISDGSWLGAYDDFTLVKGAFYPLFIAATHAVGAPLLVAQQAVALIVAGITAVSMRHLGLPRTATLILFALLALSPIVWHPDLVRVTREPLYASLGLAVFASAALALLKRDLTPLPRMVALAGFSVSFAAYWLTREESVWLYPSLAVLAVVPAVGTSAAWWRSGFPRLRDNVVPVALQGAALILPFAALAGGIAWLNQAHYGTFITNEAREGAMPSAYGALLRIREDAPAPRIFFTADAAARAYEASAAARELQPSLDGERGDNWRKIGCESLALAPCPTGFGGGWFMWALREATRDAGHMTDAATSQAFFETLATEINAACDAGKISCGPERVGMMPPLTPAHIASLPGRSFDALTLLLRFGFGDVGMAPSVGTPEQLAAFRDMAGSIAPTKDEPPSQPLGAMKLLAQTYALLVPYAFAFAMLMFAVATVFHRSVPLNCALVVVAVAAFTAVVSRAVLIATIDVTSWEAINVQYMSPAAPFVLIFIVVGIYLGARVPTSMTPLKKAANAS